MAFSIVRQSDIVDFPLFNLEKKTWVNYAIYYEPATKIFENEAFAVVFEGTIFNLESIVGKYQLGSAASIIENLGSAFYAHGPTFFSDLYGDFCFVIFDKKKEEFILGVDHLSKKSLFFNVENHQIFTDLNLILAPNIDKNSVSEYFDFQSKDKLINSRTLYQNTHRVLPGHYISLGKSWQGSMQQFYWNLNTSEAKYTLESFKEKFCASLANRKVEHAAANLSGGLDSSTVCAVASNLGIALSPLYFETGLISTDEKQYALDLCQMHGLDLTEVTSEFTALQKAQKLVQITKLPDQLFLPGTMFLDLARKTLEKGHAHIYTGEGGDAVAAYGFDYLEDLLEKELFATWYDSLLKYIEVQDFYNYEVKTLNYQERLVQKTNALLLERLKKLWLSRNFLGVLRLLKFTFQKKDFFSSLARVVFKFRRPKYTSKAVSETDFDLLRLESLLDKTALKHFKSIFSNLNMAAAFEQNSIYQAHGINAVHPFLDKEVIEIAIRLPREDLFNNGYLRGAIRENTRNILPESVRLRTSKVTFAEYAMENFLSLYHEVKDRLIPDHPVWQFVDKKVFLKACELVSDGKKDNLEKMPSLWFGNKTIYLALWLEMLETKKSRLKRSGS
jgi:asparagine synthase (glutamine-hydrolysing)